MKTHYLQEINFDSVWFLRPRDREGGVHTIRLYLYLIFTTHGILIIGDKKLKKNTQMKTQKPNTVEINFL
jgi:hypothetical protein